MLVLSSEEASLLISSFLETSDRALSRSSCSDEVDRSELMLKLIAVRRNGHVQRGAQGLHSSTGPSPGEPLGSLMSEEVALKEFSNSRTYE